MTIDLKHFGVTRETRVLKNGLKVVLFRRIGAPIASTIAFWAGSRFDPSNKPGLAHFTEHILLAGTKKWPTKDKMARYIERFGGHAGGGTSSEWLALDLTVAESRDFKVVAEVLDQMMNHSLVSPALIKSERGSIMAEIALELNRANKKLGREITTALFPNSALGHSTIGTEASVRSITRQDLLRFIEVLKRSPKVIVIAGDITMKEVEAHLSKISLGPVEAVEPAAVEIAPLDRHTVNFPFAGDNVEVGVGFRGAGYNNQDHTILEFIAIVLGEGRASVLQQKLRYEKGLVYSAFVVNNPMSSMGMWWVLTSCKKKDVKTTISIIEKEIARIKKVGLTPVEMKFVKERATNRMKFRLQSSGSWTNLHMEESLYGYDGTVIDFLKDIQGVTNAQIKDVAKRYLLDENKAIVTVGNIE